MKNNSLLLAVLMSCAACAAPNSAWVAGGGRSAEVGALAPVRGTGGSLEVEASVERRSSEETERVPLKKKNGKPWRNRYGERVEDEEDVLGRLGLRVELADWAHVALGATDELTPYARLGIEKRLTRECSIGVDLLSDRGEVVLFGLTWRR